MVELMQEAAMNAQTVVEMQNGTRIWRVLDDRCDRCRGTAIYAAQKIVDGRLLEVLFCEHHYREHSDKLFEEEWAVLNNDNVMDTA